MTQTPHYCHTDPHGLPDPACWDAMLEQYRRGWVEGHAARERELDEHLADQVSQLVANVTSDRSRTWAPAGQPQRKGMVA